jgi:glyoxylase-like metal-dependent hydrolase (beta-lactamase superfamily II)
VLVALAAAAALRLDFRQPFIGYGLGGAFLLFLAAKPGRLQTAIVVALGVAVSAIVTGGHTRDHQIAMLRTGAGCFIHLADIVPTRSHIRGPWNQAYDLDALRTMEEKDRYLRQAADEKSWVSFAHDALMFAAKINLGDGGRLAIGESIAAPRILER